MEKIMNKKTLAIMVAAAALLALPLFAAAEDKLVVEDATQNKVFSVDDAGAVNAAGNIASTGYLGLGPVATPKAVVHAQGVTSQASQLLMHRTQTNTTGGAGFLAYHNNDNSGTLTMPLTGDRLGYFLFGSYYQDTTNQYGGGVDFLWAKNGGGISAKADGNWSYTSIPTYFSFETASAGTTARSERLRIGSDGVITVNGLAGSYSGGSAFVCVNNNGQIYASETACP